jgi:hypothetical protein
MIKLFDTISSFIDLAVSIIIFPLILLVYSFIGALITIKYARLYSRKIVNYLSSKRWPTVHIPVRMNLKFHTRMMPLRKLTR